MNFYQIDGPLPLPSGSKKLDTLLSGGLVPGEMLEIYGDSGTGKTQLCMTIAAEFAKQSQSQSQKTDNDSSSSAAGHTVLYIDAKNDLIPSRLFDLCKNDPPTMRRIRVVRPNTAKDFLKVLNHFDQEIAFGQSRFAEKLKLVIIDSIPSLVYPAMQSTDFGREIQEQFSQIIKKFSTQRQVVFVVVNHAVTLSANDAKFRDIGLGDGVSFDTSASSANLTLSENKNFANLQVKPALGKFWVHVPHLRICLERETSFESIVRASLEKSSRGASGAGVKYFDFTIDAAGIK